MWTIIFQNVMALLLLTIYRLLCHVFQLLMVRPIDNRQAHTGPQASMADLVQRRSFDDLDSIIDRLESFNIKKRNPKSDIGIKVQGNVDVQVVHHDSPDSSEDEPQADNRQSVHIQHDGSQKAMLSVKVQKTNSGDEQQTAADEEQQLLVNDAAQAAVDGGSEIVITGQQEPAIDNHVVITGQQGPTVDKQIVITRKQGPTADKHIIISGHTADNHVIITKEQGPRASKHIVITGNQGPTVDKHIIISGHTADKHVIITNEQGPIARKHIVITRKKGPTADNQIVITKEQGPRVDKHIIISGHAADKHVIITKEQGPRVDKHIIISGHTGDNHVIITKEQGPRVDKHIIISGHAADKHVIITKEQEPRADKTIVITRQEPAADKQKDITIKLGSPEEEPEASINEIHANLQHAKQQAENFILVSGLAIHKPANPLKSKVSVQMSDTNTLVQLSPGNEDQPFDSEDDELDLNSYELDMNDDNELDTGVGVVSISDNGETNTNVQTVEQILHPSAKLVLKPEDRPNENDNVIVSILSGQNIGKIDREQSIEKSDYAYLNTNDNSDDMDELIDQSMSELHTYLEELNPTAILGQPDDQPNDSGYEGIQFYNGISQDVDKTLDNAAKEREHEMENNEDNEDSNGEDNGDTDKLSDDDDEEEEEDFDIEASRIGYVQVRSDDAADDSESTPDKNEADDNESTPDENEADENESAPDENEEIVAEETTSVGDKESSSGFFDKFTLENGYRQLANLKKGILDYFGYVKKAITQN